MNSVDRIEAAAKEMLSYHFDDEPVNGCKPCVLAGHTLRLAAVVRAVEYAKLVQDAPIWHDEDWNHAWERITDALAALSDQEPKHV